MTIQGEVKFEGTLHIEGQVKGNISSDQGLLTLSRSSCVEGDICVASIRINGIVKGNVYCSKHLLLSEKAIITGNVYYNAIEMAKGAEVNGNLEHLDSSVLQQAVPIDDLAIEDSGSVTVNNESSQIT